MKLYITPNSPYARIARVALIDAGLADKAQVITVQTRLPNSDFFKVTPLARVPALTHGDMLIADTADICAYFDEITGRAQFLPPRSPSCRSLHNIAAGFLDGVAVSLRENACPPNESSPCVKSYEASRALNALAWLETRFAPATWDFIAITLAVTIDIANRRGINKNWSTTAPRLTNWAKSAQLFPSMFQTAPGPA